MSFDTTHLRQIQCSSVLISNREALEHAELILSEEAFLIEINSNVLLQPQQIKLRLTQKWLAVCLGQRLESYLAVEPVSTAISS